MPNQRLQFTFLQGGKMKLRRNVVQIAKLDQKEFLAFISNGKEDVLQQLLDLPGSVQIV